MAEICVTGSTRPAIRARTSPLGPSTSEYGTSDRASWTILGLQRRPMKRLVAAATSAGRDTASSRASSPTTRTPSGVNPTRDGVRERPPRFDSTRGLPFSTVATALVEVPRSMPTTGSRMGEMEKGPTRTAGGCKGAHGRCEPPDRVLSAPPVMVNVSVARRYARALLAASAPGTVAGVADRLERPGGAGDLEPRAGRRHPESRLLPRYSGTAWWRG